MKYSIGQVLFVVLSKKSQVYPMQVTEIITKKTLNGEDISYVLQAGADKNSTVMLHQLDGEVFETSEKAREILSLRAKRQIDKLVDAAISKSKEWYGLNADSAQTIQDLPDLSTKPDIAKKNLVSQDEESTTAVVLPDGTVAKVRLPTL